MSKKASEPPKKLIYGVIECTKGNSSPTASFITREELIEDDADLTEVLRGVLLKMNWKDNKSPLVMRCFGHQLAWQKKFSNTELSEIIKKEETHAE